MDIDERAAFATAAAWFRATVDQVGEAWDEPGLGGWTVRDLVGHTSRSLVTVETYLDAEPEEVTVASAVAYYNWVVLALASGSGDDGVAERGRAAGRAMGLQPAGFLEELDGRVQTKVAGCADDAYVGTPAGGMRLIDYLPTRTFELVVHTADLRAALDLDPRAGLPAVAAGSALHLAAEIVVVRGSAPEVLRALTGRGGLPGGFSLV